MKTVYELATELSINRYFSDLNYRTVRAVGECIKIIQQDYPEIPMPVIAGGAIRDCVFGTNNKDIDVFIDLSTFSDDERDDIVLIFASRVLDKLAQYPGDFANVARSKIIASPQQGKYPGSEDRPPESWKNFVIYENTYDLDGAFIPIENPPREIYLQFIGRNDQHLNRCDYNKFVEDFDYDLVKAWFDPTTMTFNVHDLFRKQLDLKQIVVKDDKSYSRVEIWAHQWNALGGMRFPYEIILNGRKVCDYNPYRHGSEVILPPWLRPAGIRNQNDIFVEPEF